MSKRHMGWCMLLAVLLVFACSGCNDTSEPLVPTYKTQLAASEERNSEFGKVFPKQYKTYLLNNESETMTDFNGSVPWNKHDGTPLPNGEKYAQPYLKNLWLGYPFSYEYRAGRGHTYAIEDISHIDRINRYSEKAGLPATCWNCKTTKMPAWVKEHGDRFWSMEFHDFRTKQDPKDHSIGCATCHEPEAMTLRITSVPLNDYLASKGIDWKQASRNEMRALVCAQCHVEYYFTDKNLFPEKAAKPVFPWENGFSAEQMYEYYNSHGSTKDKGFEGKFTDWVHAVSKVPMLKAQHPEYEMWVDGTHGAAGVTCADCHMPYVRVDDKKKISTHQWTSPLKNTDRSCRTCHTDKTAEFLKERVIFTQKRTMEQLLIAQETSVRAHEAVRLANEYQGAKHPEYEKLMLEAREMTRKGQFFWDLISAENSVGFHNPVKAMETLVKSQQYSRKAVDAAVKATNYAIASSLDGDIKTIVPPITKHSRELQMSQEHLDSHKWLKYLPLTPKSDMVWDGQVKLTKTSAQ